MFRYLLLILALSLPLWSQQGTYNAIQAPDCQFFVYLPSGTSTTVVFDNRTAGCTDWAVTYNSSGYSAVSFLLQSAPNNAGSPGTWGAYGGTTVTGANPMTATTQTSSTFTGYQPWLRASVTLTGSGIVQGAVYGWRYRPTGSGSAGSGCPDPCPVIGVDASGTPSTRDPIQVAGNDGTDVRAIRTDTTGNTTVVGPVADGGSTVGLQPVVIGGQASGNLVRQFGLLDTLTDASATGGRSLAVGASVFDGTNWNRQRGNLLGTWIQGPGGDGVANAAAGNTVRIAGMTGGGTTGVLRTIRVGSQGALELQGGSVAQADGISNNQILPTYDGASGGSSRSINYAFNGSTWDRVRGSSTAGLTVGGYGSGASGTLYGMTACDTNVAFNIAAGSTTEIVSLTASRSIRVCSYTITASADAAQAQWADGTGTNCGTGTGILSGAMYLQLGSTISAGSGLGEVLKTRSANALCLAATTGNISGHLIYGKY